MSCPRIPVSHLKFLCILAILSTGSTAARASEPAAETADLTEDSGEMLLNVQARRNQVQPSSSAESTVIDHKEISQLPQGEAASLQNIMGQTVGGVTQSTFGVLSVKGMFTKVQYVIDGIQLPESTNDYFGDQFNAQNIDSFELITGSFPAEYGNRLGAVVNITTKSGAENDGGLAQASYGSFNSVNTSLSYGGSNAAGDWHYFLSGQYGRTDRGLDTPAPVSSTDVNDGNSTVVHDQSNTANVFFKGLWQIDNQDKLIVIASEAYKYFQIPNYPASFAITDPLFNNPDPYGNDPYYFQPAATDDTQSQNETFLQANWKHAFDEHAFVQVAPFYKYSKINFNNDPTNDLFSVYGPTPLAGAAAGSYNESRHINNLGVQADFTDRLAGDHRIKAGVRLQALQSAGVYSLTAGTTGSPPITVSDDGTTNGYLESVYVQGDIKVLQSVVVNAGVRADAMQYDFPSISTQAYQVEPRIGVNYLVTDTTKIHAYYGRGFQPPPMQNFYNAFVATQALGVGQCVAGSPCPNDVKPETDDYYDIGVDQQLGDHLVKVGAYLRNGSNTLDDQQLLNTDFVQPINYAESRAYGLEFSLRGRIDSHWSDYFNYAYNVTRVRGINGGAFAMPAGNFPDSFFVYLDQEQFHTANAALMYSTDRIWATLQGLFGSGYHTGPNNGFGLPDHLTANATVGYHFTQASWLSRFKLSVDLINIFDDHYPICLGTHFNANAFAPGREVFVNLSGRI
jgi:outer membrane receptor protein involved in Fe transport